MVRVRWRTNGLNVRESIPRACGSAASTATKSIVGRCATSGIALTSEVSVF